MSKETKQPEEWKQDFAVLHQGDERYKRQLACGRVLTLIVERDEDSQGEWEARMSGANGARMRLNSKFTTKEKAMGAIEKKAFELLRLALEDLAPKVVVYIAEGEGE